MEIIIGIFGKLLWPVLLALGALLAAWGYGARKKREGRQQERARAREARDLAADEAASIRDNAAAKPTSKKREEVSKWEK